VVCGCARIGPSRGHHDRTEGGIHYRHWLANAGVERAGIHPGRLSLDVHANGETGVAGRAQRIANLIDQANQDPGGRRNHGPAGKPTDNLDDNGKMASR
jgi:hypothetical protein